MYELKTGETGMNQDVIAFVILHYISIKDTINCVNSIQMINVGIEYFIVIVDNASPNKSGEELVSLYKDNENIQVVLSKKNLGFAQGNNLGYYYAKKKFGANFIIVTNNDVIFNDSWKFHNILEIYNRTKADIIGPDIVSEEGEHWSPFRLEPVTSFKLVKRRIRNRKIILFYYRCKKKFKFLDRVMILENMMEKEKNKRTNRTAYDTEQIGIVLHGACILFTPSFIKNEEEAFDSRTFMYGEEDLLAQKAKKKGYCMCYTPCISAVHIGEKATKEACSINIEREIFMHKNMLKGYQLLLEELGDE